MNKKGLIVLLILIVVLAGVFVYFTLPKKPVSISNQQSPTTSASVNYEKDSLSWTYIGPQNSQAKVYLYAPDQAATTNQNPYGFAMEGDKIVGGHYKLFLSTNTAMQADLGQLQFNLTRPLIDGKLKLIQLDKNNNAVAYYQYGSSNTDVIYIYRYLSGNFSLVHFISKDGKPDDFTETGLGAPLISNPDGSFTSKWYDNTRGYVTTKWKYTSTDNNFHEVSTSVSTNP